MRYLYINHKRERASFKSFFNTLIFVFLFLGFGASSAWADRTITYVTFNPTVVQPNDLISTTVTVLIDGNPNGANGRWGSTKVKIESVDDICIDHDDRQGAGTYNISFDISISTPGTYDVAFTAYASDDCKGNQDSRTYTPTNTIIVENNTPPPPTGNYRYTACQWSEIFEDYTFDGWNYYGNGIVSQSTEQQKYGAHSLKKSSNNDPHGGWKSLGQSVHRDYVFEGWLYRPSNSNGGSEDRIAISDDNFNGYGFRIRGNQVFIERRNAGNPQNISSGINWNRTSNEWYRFRFKANMDNTFTLWIYNESGVEQFALTSNADTTHSGNFDRVVVHGGHHYYADGLSVRTCGTNIELDLSVSPLIVNAGAQFRVDINISNSGSGDTDNLELTFPFGSDNGISPSSQTQGNWTCVTNAQSIVCSDGKLSANDAMRFSLDFNTSTSTDSVTNQDVIVDGRNASDTEPISFTINKAPVVNNTHFEVTEGYRSVGNFDISDPEDDSFDYYLTDNNATMFNYTDLQNFSFKEAQEYKEDGNNTYTFDVIAEDSKGAISRTTVTVEVIEDVPNYSCPNPHSPSIAFFDTINGGSGIFGNTALCQNSGGVCAEPANNARNNNINMMFADVDGDSSTFQSTSANMEINGTILWAGLYWQGFLFDQNTSQKERTKYVKLKTPGTGYTDITADIHSWIYYGGNAAQAGQRFYYQGFKDITSEVQAGGSGTYTIADILTAEGRPIGGSFGAWAIAYAYQNDDMKLKNITIFDSFQGLVGSGDRNGAIAYSNANGCNLNKIGVGTTIDSLVDGFLTPHTGTIDSSLFVFAGEGDIGATGDRLSLANKNGIYQQLSNAANPANDIFNASISYFGTHLKTLKPGSKNPDYQNNLGIDIDTFDVSSIIQNEQTHTTIRLTTNGDGYQPAVYGFETIVQEPDIRNFTKSAYLVEVNGSRTALSSSHEMKNDEIMEYWLDFNNSGQEIATNVEIFDDLDSDGISSYADYVNGSVTLEDINNIGASYSCGNNQNKIYCRINRMDIDDRYIMKFQVKTKNINCNDQNVSFSNTAQSSYYNIVTGMRVNFSGKSNLNIAGTICPASSREGNFTVVDTLGLDNQCNALDDWYNNIRTKIVGSASSFWILAKSSPSDVMADANITSVKIKNCAGYSDYEKEICSNCGTTNDKGCLFISTTPSENLASKCVEFYITGVDGASSSIATETSSVSEDSFAIRPERFFLEAPSVTQYAAEEFIIRAFAYNYGDYNTTLNYNEMITNAGAVRMDANETRVDCSSAITDNFNLTNTQFSNARADVNLSYDGLADNLTIKIAEVNGEEFAFVDRDDTADALRFITPYELNVTVEPYELNVTRSEIDASIAGSEWIYMADVKDMNITLLAEVSAFNKNGVALRDFNASCYAEDVNVAFEVATDGNAALAMNYGIAQGEFVTLGDTLGDINKILTIRAENFLSGKGSASYALNVDREFSAPVAPFKVGGLDVNVTTTNISKVVNGNFRDGNFTFYYGRASAKDIKTSQVVADHFAEFEVYDPTNYINKGFKQNSLNWYRNQDHNAVAFGNISSIDSQPSDINNAPLNAVNNGLITFSINNTAGTKSANMHIRTDKWLWYTPIDNGFDNTNTDCSQHPCFKYTFTPSSLDKRGIQSGSFQGSDIDVKDRGDYQKTGIKVFR